MTILKKQSRLVITTTDKETPPGTKLPYAPCHGVGKGLMTSKGPIAEQRPPLLLEDLRYALGQLSSIIKDKDYKDLGNHATGAMKETAIFSLVQVCDHLLVLSVLFPSVSSLPLYFTFRGR